MRRRDCVQLVVCVFVVVLLFAWPVGGGRCGGGGTHHHCAGRRLAEARTAKGAAAYETEDLSRGNETFV